MIFLFFFFNKSGRVARLSQARKLKVRRERTMRYCYDFTVTIVVLFNIRNILYIVFSSHFCKYNNSEIRNIRSICETCYDAWCHHRNIATMLFVCLKLQQSIIDVQNRNNASYSQFAPSSRCFSKYYKSVAAKSLRIRVIEVQIRENKLRSFLSLSDRTGNFDRHHTQSSVRSSSLVLRFVGGESRKSNDSSASALPFAYLYKLIHTDAYRHM